jgi:hypothetical protein
MSSRTSHRIRSRRKWCSRAKARADKVAAGAEHVISGAANDLMVRFALTTV